VVSSDDDPGTADAAELVSDSLPVFEAQNCADHLRHLRVPGAHALDQRRFDAILEWMAEQSIAGLANQQPTSGKPLGRLP
jgi:hypothetical protein